MTTLYLIRHAEAEGNVYRRSHGQYDALLTARGFAQLPYLAKRFADVPLDAVYASDLYRARHTAKAVADTQGLKVHLRPVLREIYMGDWEDRTWAELPLLDEAQAVNWRVAPWKCTTPNGESVVGAGVRLLGGLTQLAAEHPGESIAVASHGLAIRGAMTRILGKRDDQMTEIGWADNTCVTKLLYEDSAFHAEYWYDASHLPEELSTFAALGWKDTKKGVPLTKDLWYRPYDPASSDDRALLCTFARQFYTSAYGDTAMLDENAYIAETDQMAALSPRAVTFGICDGQPVALVRLNVCDTTEPTVGKVGSFVIREDYQGCGFSQQILGQAISFYRAMGKAFLRADVAEHNARAQGFYKKFAFENRGAVVNARGRHFAMYKPIHVPTVEEEAADFILDEPSPFS